MLVSACMIVKDEARHLRKCLRSLLHRRDLINEIIVVDTGSTDGTQAIAAELGARVLGHSWGHDFSAARNVALSAATARYCLMIDADEEVEQESWLPFQEFLHRGESLGRITQVSTLADDDGSVIRESITRVCRNDGRFHYVGRIHEQLQGPAQAMPTGLSVLHTGYQGEAQRKDKVLRNLAILEEELACHPGEPYVHYQIARTLSNERPHVAINHYGLALGAIGQAEETGYPAYLPSLVREMGYTLRDHGRGAEALLLVQRYLPRFADFTDLHFLHGLLQMDHGDASAMLAAFTQCLRLGPPDPARYPSTVEGAGTYRAHYNLGLFAELCGQTDRARAHYEAALHVRPDFRPALTGLCRLG